VAFVTSGFEDTSIANHPPFSPVRPTNIMDKKNTADTNMAGGAPPEGDGSKSNPYVLVVNKKQAESHRELNVQHVEGIISQDVHKRNGWHICTRIDIEDRKKWSAVVQAEHTILIKGPLCEAADHEAFAKKIDCTATTEHHKETAAQIYVNEDRQFAHWLLVFPQGTCFDNMILSGDQSELENCG
jgi:hypothetical protein